MTDVPQDIFQTMNASRILVAILTHLKSIEIPTELFMQANNQDRELNVSYDDEKLSFTFSLRDNNEQ